MGKRMTISLSDALENDINQIIGNGKASVGSKSEAFRNAIVLYKVLLDEVSKGNKLTIADEDNHIIKEIVMAH